MIERTFERANARMQPPEVLEVRPDSRMGVISALISARGYKSYLEIGCQFDWSFNTVAVDVKVGVDPAMGGTHRMTSDAFFEKNKDVFDIIFIDGDHSHPQVLRDIENALAVLSPGGAIVMHDCLPDTREHESPSLCGTAWRAFAKYRENNKLNAITGDFDHGVGILRVEDNPSKVELPCGIDDLTYNMLLTHRDKWMRPHDLAGVQEFIRSWPE